MSCVARVMCELDATFCFLIFVCVVALMRKWGRAGAQLFPSVGGRLCITLCVGDGGTRVSLDAKPGRLLSGVDLSVLSHGRDLCARVALVNGSSDSLRLIL